MQYNDIVRIYKLYIISVIYLKRLLLIAGTNFSEFSRNPKPLKYMRANNCQLSSRHHTLLCVHLFFNYIMETQIAKISICQKFSVQKR